MKVLSKLVIINLLTLFVTGAAADVIPQSTIVHNPFKVPANIQQLTGSKDQLAATLSLRGIILGSSKRLANINGQVVEEGELVGDYRVISIGETDVTLQKGSVQISIQLASKQRGRQ